MMLRFGLALVMLTLVASPARAQSSFGFVSRQTDPSAKQISADDLNKAGATKANAADGTLLRPSIAALPSIGMMPPAAIVGSTVPLSSAIGVCTPKNTTAFVGAINGGTDLATAANYPNFAATQNWGFYFTSYALTQVAGLSTALPTIVSNFTSRSGAGGIIEVGTDPVNMPDIANQYASYVTDANGWTWGTTKGTTWPAIASAAGWKPVIAALNPFYMSGNSTSDPYYQMNLLAIADIKRVAPSVQHVLPILTPNGAVVSTANNNLNWTDSVWGESVALATAAGGLELDTPANYFLRVREPAYRALVAQEIQWANANGYISAVLLSPYDMTGGAQEGDDTSFLAAAQQEVAYLHNAGADPTLYIAANYGEASTSNKPGTDTTSNSIAQVAYWLAQHAPTTPWAGGTLMTGATRVCATSFPAGRPGPAVNLGDIGGLGDMAFQNSYAVNIQGGYGNFTGGLQAAGLTSLSDVTVNVGKSFTVANNGQYPAYLNGDGVGNVYQTTGVPNGNWNLQGNALLSGDILLNALSAVPSTITATGVGVLNLDSGLDLGQVKIRGDLHMTVGTVYADHGLAVPLASADPTPGGSCSPNGRIQPATSTLDVCLGGVWTVFKPAQ